MTEPQTLTAANITPICPSSLDPGCLQPIFDIIEMFTEMYGEQYYDKVQISLSGQNLANALTGKAVLFDLGFTTAFINNKTATYNPAATPVRTVRNVPVESFSQVLSLFMAQPNKYNGKFPCRVIEPLAKLVVEAVTE